MSGRNFNLGMVICPGCGKKWEGLEQYIEETEFIHHENENIQGGCCTECGYENGSDPYRLLTISEMLLDIRDCWHDVSLGKFLRVVLDPTNGNSSEPAEEPAPTPEPEAPAAEEPAYLPLSALLAVREELNTILPPPLSLEHFGMALIEEIGELVRTLRYGIWDRPGQDWEPGWCWWHWAEETKGQEMSAPSSIVREELADILLLILLHKTSYCGDKIVDDEFWDTCWLGRAGGTAWGYATLLHWIQAALIMRNDPRGALSRFAELCESLGEGFGRREIETAYLAKAQRNRERLQRGER